MLCKAITWVLTDCGAAPSHRACFRRLANNGDHVGQREFKTGVWVTMGPPVHWDSVLDARPAGRWMERTTSRLCSRTLCMSCGPSETHSWDYWWGGTGILGASQYNSIIAQIMDSELAIHASFVNKPCPEHHEYEARINRVMGRVRRSPCGNELLYPRILDAWLVGRERSLPVEAV